MDIPPRVTLDDLDITVEIKVKGDRKGHWKVKSAKDLETWHCFALKDWMIKDKPWMSREPGQ